MPKDEFDFDDPMELNGVGLVCEADTTEAMTECFVEEFMRLGHNAQQILALFRNPHYLGMHLAIEKRGEQFVREKIAAVFARWGKSTPWQRELENPLPPALSPSEGDGENRPPARCEPETALAAKSLEQPETARPLFPLPRRGGEGQGEGVTNVQPRPTSLPEQTIVLDATITDPMGIPVPKLNT